MKLGRMSGQDVDDLGDILRAILRKKGKNAVCFLLAPHLVSEKVKSGKRGEMRPLE